MCLLLWTVVHFQHLKWKTKQTTIRMNLRCDAVIGGCFFFSPNCKVSSRDVRCVQDTSRSGRVMLNHCYLIQWSGDSCYFSEEDTYKAVNQLNSSFGISQENTLCQPPPATSMTGTVWLTTTMSVRKNDDLCSLRTARHVFICTCEVLDSARRCCIILWG